MSEEEPEAKDGLGQHIENSIGDDLSVETDDTAAVSNTPDAATISTVPITIQRHSHRIDGPENEGESSNSTIESLGLAVLARNRRPSIESKLINHDQVRNTSPRIPAPLLAILVTVCRKQTRQDHDQIGHNSDEDVGTSKTSQKTEIEEEKWGGDAPVDVTCPVDLAVDDLLCVWDVLVGLDLLDHVVIDAVAGGHREVGEEGEGGDEGGQDVEKAFLLDGISTGASQ
jgi:hypothetical protein